jgi:hypothetical protein
MRHCSGLVLATLLATVSTAQAEAPVTSPDPDSRTVIYMDDAGRDLVLAEMRMFLEGVQQITAGLAGENLDAAIAAARGLGLGAMGDVPPAVMQQLPLEFRQLGRSTHADFDQIAMDLETLGDRQHALRQLGDTLGKCVACHATWRIERGDLERGLRP